jgi:DNA replication protein DnaC
MSYRAKLRFWTGTWGYDCDERGKIFEETVAAAAIIDRVVRHANIFYVNGGSYRLKDKLKRGKTSNWKARP